MKPHFHLQGEILAVPRGALAGYDPNSAREGRAAVSLSDRWLLSSFVAATMLGAPLMAAAQMPPPVTEALVPAHDYFGGKNVAIGECAPSGMLGSKKPCGDQKGSAKFLVTENLADGDYLLEIQYVAPAPRPVLLRVDDEPVVRALEEASGEPRWAMIGVYRLSGVFTTIEIESVAGFPAIGAVRLSLAARPDVSP